MRMSLITLSDRQTNTRKKINDPLPYYFTFISSSITEKPQYALAFLVDFVLLIPLFVSYRALCIFNEKQSKNRGYITTNEEHNDIRKRVYYSRETM